MAEVPTNNTPRKPTGKKAFSLDNFKKKTGTQDVPDKPTKWFKLSDAFQKETGLPGLPMGYVIITGGHPNTGKSTLALEAAVGAQREGILPIIFDLENNIGRHRLEMMGFDLENCIHINQMYLLENFGKKKDKKRELASIEDFADCVNFFLDQQENGELPIDIIMIVDSIGTLDGNQHIHAQMDDKEPNNMWNAGAYEKAFKSIVNYRIPNTRKVTSEYTCTFLAVNKISVQHTSMGLPSIRFKNGDTFKYAARLIFHHGGIAAGSVKNVTATSKGRDIKFATEAKIKVEKNHVDGKYGGISFEGKLISTPHGFIGTDKDDLAEYKKKHIQYFRDLLDNEDLNADDIDHKFMMDDNGDVDVDEFNRQFGDTE